MIFLDTTTRSLEFKLAGAVTLNQLPFVASYADLSQSTFGLAATGTNDGASNGIIVVTLVAAPGASTTRQLKFLSIQNQDTASATVTVQLNDNGTIRQLGKWALAVNDTLQYTDSHGFEAIDSAAALKTVQASSILVSAGDVLGTSVGGTLTAALATSGVAVGTYGAAIVTAQLVVDAKGRLTSATNAGTLGTMASFNSYVLAGDVLGTSTTGTLTSALATSGVASGTYGGTNIFTQFVVNAKGILTSGTNAGTSAATSSVGTWSPNQSWIGTGGTLTIGTGTNIVLLGNFGIRGTAADIGGALVIKGTAADLQYSGAVLIH